MENVVYGRVYLVKNLINGKVYIGQTKRRLAERWSHHKCDAKRSKSLFAKALMKYGANNFSIVELCICFDRLTLDLAEKGFIEAYDSTNVNKGYNIKPGGNKTALPKEFYQKKSLEMKGERHPNYKKQMPEHVRAALLASNLGRKHSKEHRDKISAMQLGKSKKKWSDEARRRFSEKRKLICAERQSIF